MHVSIVSLYFHPDMSGTGQVLTDLAIGLREMGCSVSAYTTHPAFGSRERLQGSELYRGVHIHRVFRTHLNETGRVRRFVNMITFFFSVLWALLISREKGSLLIVSHPPFLVLAGYLIAKLKGRPYVYLVHDVFPDGAVAVGYISANGIVRKIWDKVNRFSVGHAARIIVLCESMKRIMLKKPGSTDESRVYLIHNWVDEAYIRPREKTDNWFVDQQGLRDKFVVLYSGSMGYSDDLETVIAAAERFQDGNALFLFVGEGGQRRKIQEIAEKRKLENVRFLPYQSQETLPFSLTSADVSLIALKKGIEGLCMPSKLYGILASGRPVVALVEPDLDVAEIITKADCGKSVPPGDVEGLVRALQAYYADKTECARAGRNGRQYLEAWFTRSEALREYYEVLESTSRGPRKDRVAATDQAGSQARALNGAGN